MTPFHKIEQKSYRNAKLLSEVINVTGLKNDAALSRALEVAPPVISKIRNGKLPVGATMAIQIHELINMPIKRITAILSGE